MQQLHDPVGERAGAAAVDRFGDVAPAGGLAGQPPVLRVVLDVHDVADGQGPVAEEPVEAGGEEGGLAVVGVAFVFQDLEVLVGEGECPVGDGVRICDEVGADVGGDRGGELLAVAVRLQRAVGRC